MKFAPLLLAPAILLSSCATIVSKSDYPVAITSNPTGCVVVVKNSEGQAIAKTTTPNTITLKSSNGYFRPASYTFEFTTPKGKTQIVPVKAGLNGWYVGNIVFGGLIGLVIVDPLTGAMWRLDDAVGADFSPNPIATIDDGNGRKVAFVDRTILPADVQKKMVALR